MSKKEIFCCIGCGRDTTSNLQLCPNCQGHGSNFFSRKSEQKGRSALPISCLSGAEGMNIGDGEEYE